MEGSSGSAAPKIRLVLSKIPSTAAAAAMATAPPRQSSPLSPPREYNSYTDGGASEDAMSDIVTAEQPQQHHTTGFKLKINRAAIHLKKRRKPVPRYGNNPPTAEEMEVEPFPTEEHLIFRMPPNDPLTPRLREIIQQRLPFPPDLSIEWRDSRRGLLQWGEEVLLAKLVDLPCIIESQKTFDRKQFYKVADICQMIVIERPRTEADIDRFFNRLISPEDTIFNSGITPPLKYCRIRRFRRRVNRRTVESIEREVARLMREDARAIEVQTEFVDSKELEDRLNAEDEEEDELVHGEINFADDEDYGEDADRGVGDDEYADVDGGQGAGGEGGYQSDDTIAQLENEISRAVAEASDSSGDEDEEDEEDEGLGAQTRRPGEEAEEDEEEEDDSGDEEMDEQTRLLMQQQKALRDEMKNLNEKIVEKTVQRNQTVNLLVQKRFDDIIRKLTTELELKQSQLAKVQFSLQKRATEGDYDDDDDDVGDADLLLAADGAAGDDDED